MIIDVYANLIKSTNALFFAQMNVVEVTRCDAITFVSIRFQINTINLINWIDSDGGNDVSINRLWQQKQIQNWNQTKPKWTKLFCFVILLLPRRE